ncbi:hypothetical protein Dimus_007989 [Dionaea muscipula]
MKSQSRISHDASHLLSGSSDGNAYIWQNFHEQGKIVTKIDDFTIALSFTQLLVMHTDLLVLVFVFVLRTLRAAFYPPTRSPASIRRKAIAVPSSKPKGLDRDAKTWSQEVPRNSPLSRRLAHKQEEQVMDPGVVVVKRATMKKGAQVAKIPNPRKQKQQLENIKERKSQRKLVTEESEVAAIGGVARKREDLIIVNIDEASGDDELAAAEYAEDIYKFYKLTEGRVTL